MNWTSCRALMAAAAFVAALSPVSAQQQPPQPAQANPFCSRLEAQLQAFDRSGNDSGRGEQLRKFEEAATNQQNEIDRQQAIAQRAGCEKNSFLVLFSGQSAQCGPLNNKIQAMRDNLVRIQGDIERLRGGDAAPERASQRRAILVALSQNNCGQQYQQQVAATPPPQRGGLFESLFGPKSIFTPGDGGAPGSSGPEGTFRTVCVRTCDGFYYPISAATTPARFVDDEKTCRQSCPAADAQIYSLRNTGEDMNQAVSVTTQLPYTSLANAFRYRTALDQACTCKRPGETWSQALKNIEDTTVEQGDIVVNDQRARQLSQPRVDAQGRPIRVAPLPATARPDPRAAQAAPPAAPAAAAAAAESEKAADEGPSKPDPNRKVRSVGPTFLPGR